MKAQRASNRSDSGAGLDSADENFGAFTLAPNEYTVAQNYPNPFNPETVIPFGLPEPSFVTITISDAVGRVVVTLVEKEYTTGYKKATWRGIDGSGKRVGNGVYYYRITAVGQSGRSFTRILKMTLAK